MKLSGIVPELHTRLREVLARCGPFHSDAALAAIFADARIHPWADAVLAAPSKTERVEAVIHLLYEQYNDQGENALLLLLGVLHDRAEPGTSCRGKLAQLAEALARAQQVGDGVGVAEGDAGVFQAAHPAHTSDGIRAGRIKAKNVVKGVQLPSGAVPAGLAELAQAVQGGAIVAEEDLEADHIVSGVQVRPEEEDDG